MKEAKLEVQPTESKFWSAIADVRQYKGLPTHPAIDEFAALTKRSFGGIGLLGGAAATEQYVTVFVAAAPTLITVHAEKRVGNSVFYAGRLRQFQVAQATPP